MFAICFQQGDGELRFLKHFDENGYDIWFGGYKGALKFKSYSEALVCIETNENIKNMIKPWNEKWLGECSGIFITDSDYTPPIKNGYYVKDKQNNDFVEEKRKKLLELTNAHSDKTV